MPASSTDYTNLVESGDNVFLADQWPLVVRAIQGLALYFEQKVAEGVEPADILVGITFGEQGQSVNRNDWRIVVEATTEDLLFQRNTGTEAVPVWTTRFTLDDAIGLDETTIDHDALLNFVVNEHLDWTAASVGTIDSTNLEAIVVRSNANQEFSRAQGTTESTPSSVANVLTLDFDESNYFEVLLTENVTSIVINNTTRPGPRTIRFQQDGVGGHTVDFTGPPILFPGGTDPVISPGISAIDYVSINVTSTGALEATFAQDMQ